MTTSRAFLLLLGLGMMGSCTARPPQTGTAGAAAAPVAPVASDAGQTAMQDSTAEKMLVFQRSIGGWPKAVGSKKVDYKHPLSATERAATLSDKGRTDATIDNNATTREIAYLAKAYQATNNAAYRQGAETGIRYLLKMQY